jgi:predicted Zn finger-like uncharacterized protein
MRLVCPSCEAKYEVPEDAIPDTGRDVQCANCGHAWFQMRQRAAGAEGAALVLSSTTVGDIEAASAKAAEAAMAPTPDAGVEMAEPVVATEVGAREAVDAPATDQATEAVTDVAEAIVETPAAEADAVGAAEAVSVASEPAHDASMETADPPPAADPVPAQSAAAYAVDEGVLAILREEAEREAQARRAEAQPAEASPGPGGKSTSGKRKKPVVVATPVEAAEADVGAKPSARRDLLPDVEEINSTLRPSEVAEDAAAMAAGAAASEAKGGFRSGFLVVMTLAIVGAVVYIAAPALSSLIPGLSDGLTSYVAAVDTVRLSLDGVMRSATVAINGQ